MIEKNQTQFFNISRKNILALGILLVLSIGLNSESTEKNTKKSNIIRELLKAPVPASKRLNIHNHGACGVIHF